MGFLKNFKNISLQANGFFAKKLGSGWSWNDYQASYMVERNSFPMYGNLVRFYLRDRLVKSSPAFFEKTISPSDNQSLKGMTVNRARDSNKFLVTSGEARSVTMPFSTSESPFEEWVPSLQAKLLADTLKIPVTAGLCNVKQAENFKKFYSQHTDSLLKPMMHRSDNFLQNKPY